MRALVPAIALLGLVACGGGGQAGAGAGGVTAGEAEALDHAAKMLEEQRLPDDALRPPAGSEQPAAPAAQQPAAH